MSPDEDLGLGTIQSVSLGTREYISREHRTLFISVTIIALIASACFAYLLYFALTNGGDTQSIKSAAFLTIIPYVLPLLMYRYFAGRVQKLFVQQLAAAIGFTYSRGGDVTSVSGTFFSMGHGQSLYDVMSGIYKNHPVRIYSYKYTTGSGKEQQTHLNTVFEMNCEAMLPHITVNVPGIELFSPSGMEKVELEGEFSKQFNVHVETGKQMEIREIFQPDVMADLVDSFSKYSLETSEKMFYVIKSGTISERKSFLDMVTTVDHLFDTLIPELDAMARGQGTPVAAPPTVAA